MYVLKRRKRKLVSHCEKVHIFWECIGINAAAIIKAKAPQGQPIDTDILEIERLKEAVKTHVQPFLDHILTKEEQAFGKKLADPTSRYAGCFATKEAIVKAVLAKC